MTIYILIGLVLTLGTVYIVKRSSERSNENHFAKNEPHPGLYSDLRNKALTVTPEQLELKDIKPHKVYGIVTDMVMDNGTATIIAFLSGDASIYLSTGGGFVGGGTHDDINKKVKLIVDKLDEYKVKANKTDKIDLPTDNNVNFTFLTKEGLYQIIEDKDKIFSGESEHTDLYKEVDQITTLIRIKSGH